jgi:hypothetical protein
MWGDKKKEEVIIPDEKKVEAPPALTADDIAAKMSALLDPFKASIENIDKRLTAAEEARKPKEQSKSDEQVSVLDDENAAFNQRLGPLAIETIKTNARLTEREVLDEVRDKGLTDFIPQIKEQFGNTPIQVKADPNYERYCHNVVDMIVGREAQKGGLKAKGNRFILEDSSTADDKTHESTLADADREWLNFEVITPGSKKHVTRKEFLTRMGHDLSDPKVLEGLKKSWDTMQVVN